MAKAATLNLTTSIPEMAAAVSSSRIDSRANPIHDVTNQRSRTMHTSTNISVIQKKEEVLKGDRMPPIPMAPPKKGTYRKTAWTTKLMPIVVIAKKSSLTRRQGMASREPVRAVMAIVIGSPIQKGRPRRVERRAEQ